MHTKPVLQDWQVKAINSNCVHIKIDDDLSLEGVKIRVLGESRNFLFDVVPQNRDITLCTPTGNPMFVELHTPTGVSVQYVMGSGSEFYSKN